MAYVIAQPCVGVKDGACAVVCPVDCIQEGEEQFFIDPDRCIDCGACAPVCPVGAIFRAEELPEHWKGFIFKNRAFYG